MGAHPREFRAGFVTAEILASSGAHDYPNPMTQLALDLPRRTAFGRSDFMVSDSNVAAVERIDRWPDWPSAVLVLHGPPGCGKTHLVHLWCERASALMIAGEKLTLAALPRLLDEDPRRVAIDDSDRASEHALLQLHNTCLEHQGSILITARRPPGSWGLMLGDLRSRLRAALAAEIDAPDDALLGAVLIKHFADRQLRVAPNVIAFLLRRIERSFAAAENIAARLDAAALHNGSPVTIPLARKILTHVEHQPLPLDNESAVT
jgi:chromosomal replication initiation ATPase DnaA